jgi:hypothetical protein
MPFDSGMRGEARVGGTMGRSRGSVLLMMRADKNVFGEIKKVCRVEVPRRPSEEL